MSPKDQFQYSTFVVSVVSLNWTPRGTYPNVVLLVNVGIGGGAEAFTKFGMDVVFVFVAGKLSPVELVMLRFTV